MKLITLIMIVVVQLLVSLVGEPKSPIHVIIMYGGFILWDIGLWVLWIKMKPPWIDAVVLDPFNGIGTTTIECKKSS